MFLYAKKSDPTGPTPERPAANDELVVSAHPILDMTDFTAPHHLKCRDNACYHSQ